MVREQMKVEGKKRHRRGMRRHIELKRRSGVEDREMDDVRKKGRRTEQQCESMDEHLIVDSS